MARTIKAVTFLLPLLVSTFSFAQSASILPRPQPLSSFNSTNTNTTTQNQGGCSYTVVIKTSCSSTRYTRDQVSLYFGDAYGYQVYVPRIDDPRSRTFERCSTDTFHITGPCTYQICLLYLKRTGPDGWKPESVKVFGYYSRAVTFYYNEFIPGGIWYGFDNCRDGRRGGGGGLASSE